MGGYAQANLKVTPGETLYVVVGNSAGFNGGGNAGTPFSGGGASDVRQGGSALTNTVVVAGGGGASGTTSHLYANSMGEKQENGEKEGQEDTVHIPVAEVEAGTLEEGEVLGHMLAVAREVEEPHLLPIRAPGITFNKVQSLETK